MDLKTLIAFVLIVNSFYLISAKPIRKEKTEVKDTKKEEEGEYLRYLGQVVEILEEDEEFKKKLHNATEDEIRSGKIADHVDLLSHNVRTKLDELKRMEVESQRRLNKHKRDKMNGINERNFWSPLFDENQETFETEDLQKLLHKHSSLLEEQDKKRKQDFHTYEMDKEHKRREELKQLNGVERKTKEQEHDEEMKKLKTHDKMHQPGSKAELEEVWKEEDGLDPESFDPKTFFKLHDKNGDGYLDSFELETFFLGDVDKAYNESDSHTDPKERQEELERMREHVMKQMDKDSDGLVSTEEFINSTHDPEYEKDEEWKPAVDQDEYSEEELKEYERQLDDEAAKNGDHEQPRHEKDEEHHEEGEKSEPEHHDDSKQGEHHEEGKKSEPEHHDDSKQEEHHEKKQEQHQEQQQHHEQPKEHQDQQQQHHDQQQQQHQEQPKVQQH